MSQTMEMLQTEHRIMSELLDLLERQVDLFEEGGEVDYDLLGEIIDYYSSYTDLYHHSKEDLVFESLIKRDPEAAVTMGDLEAAHDKVNDCLNRFTRAVVNVLLGKNVARSAFIAIARDFLDGERRHMTLEETIFFPAAKKSLTDEDWKEIDARVAKFRDPLHENVPIHRFERVQKELAAEGSYPNLL